MKLLILVLSFTYVLPIVGGWIRTNTLSCPVPSGTGNSGPYSQLTGKQCRETCAQLDDCYAFKAQGCYIWNFEEKDTCLQSVTTDYTDDMVFIKSQECKPLAIIIFSRLT